jgi:uncharacterized membrane protein YqaE (UPF0057 family)
MNALLALLAAPASDGGASGVALIIGILVAYFIPTGVAVSNKKTNSMAIFALNLLLGWTVLGWIVALIWALTKDPVVQRPA